MLAAMTRVQVPVVAVIAAAFVIGGCHDLECVLVSRA